MLFCALYTKIALEEICKNSFANLLMNLGNDIILRQIINIRSNLDAFFELFVFVLFSATFSGAIFYNSGTISELFAACGKPWVLRMGRPKVSFDNAFVHSYQLLWWIGCCKVYGEN